MKSLSLHAIWRRAPIGVLLALWSLQLYSMPPPQNSTQKSTSVEDCTKGAKNTPPMIQKFLRGN